MNLYETLTKITSHLKHFFKILSFKKSQQLDEIQLIFNENTFKSISNFKFYLIFKNL
jgi:hypothetical protein